MNLATLKSCSIFLALRYSVEFSLNSFGCCADWKLQYIRKLHQTSSSLSLWKDATTDFPAREFRAASHYYSSAELMLNFESVSMVLEAWTSIAKKISRNFYSKRSKKTFLILSVTSYFSALATRSQISRERRDTHSYYSIYQQSTQSNR